MDGIDFSHFLQEGPLYMNSLLFGSSSQPADVIHPQLSMNLMKVDQPVQDSSYPMVVARLLAPIKSPQNCKHLIFRSMVHHGGLQVPSTQAIGKDRIFLLIKEKYGKTGKD